jgi:hypothetical protein
MTPILDRWFLLTLHMLLIWGGLFGGPDRDRTDDLFHAMENSARRLQTAKDLTAGTTGKTGTMGAIWHQIGTKTGTGLGAERGGTALNSIRNL